jgi:hypothetical protein
MSNLQVTREKLPTGTAEPQISGFFSKLLAAAVEETPTKTPLLKLLHRWRDDAVKAAN